MRALLCVLALAGCGRVGFDELTDGARTDIADAPQPTGPFGTPMLVAELDSAFADDDPTLTGDQLEIYFNSNRSADSEIWRATRNSITGPWDAPQLVPELSAIGPNENTPEISYDGLTIYLTSDRLSGDNDIYMATRTSRTSMWSSLTAVTELNSIDPDAAPSFIANGTELYIARVIAPNGNEIMTSSRGTPSAPWSPPMLVTELSDALNDSDPCIASDDLTIYWKSDRVSAGNEDIWRATRPAPGAPFANIAPAAELNTTSDRETDPWISADGHTMYFARGPTTTNVSIYMATR